MRFANQTVLRTKRDNVESRYIAKEYRKRMSTRKSICTHILISNKVHNKCDRDGYVISCHNSIVCNKLKSILCKVKHDEENSPFLIA